MVFFIRTGTVLPWYQIWKRRRGILPTAADAKGEGGVPSFTVTMGWEGCSDTCVDGEFDPDSCRNHQHIGPAHLVLIEWGES
jgi:hypothetical protein